MSMPWILIHLGLFSEGGDRVDSEQTILYLLEAVTDRNCRFLRRHPNTPKLYDSGVVYAVPDQMADNKIGSSKMNDCARFLKRLGASDETIEVVLAFLQGIEVFRDIPTVYEKGAVDCDNLACIRAAELRMAGVNAVPYIIWREMMNGTTYHALVRWPDGTSEDPSLLLGMGGAAKTGERVEERRKNRERFENFITATKILCDAGEMTIPAAGDKIKALGLLPVINPW